MIPISIQIVEGNPNLASLLGWHLQQVGYSVIQTAGLPQAKLVFQKQQPSLIVLSSDLPDGDGIELCRWMYKQRKALIFIISAHAAETDVVVGLKAGADDYLAKPFGIQEFLARVEALTRRIRQGAPPAYLDYGNLKIDLVQRQVRLKGIAIDLTPQEFSLLYVLAQAEGAAISRAELLQRAWPDEINNPRTVDTHVLSLRKKIELDPQQPNLIQTVRNVGYRFNTDALMRSPVRNNLNTTTVSSNPTNPNPNLASQIPNRVFAKY
ncbi:response regulator transcription factor [Tumidithrix elongata RA019]|uniref:Response regulator transcription factor n=1 Tax=Tumidithrix elongata BACA0141 TaxID=2716417 RepID=A0AAW9PR52_9CYAN|nr:response regulator transcription factor [Tumidithrix elongata RA019]